MTSNPTTPLPADVFASVVDFTMERLTSGRTTERTVALLYRLHVGRLTRAGFTENEAVASFWDVVATARHLSNQEDPR